MDLAVDAQSLTKRYGEFEAVRGIDFSVRRGECFGFLGANGAGKSTTMRMIYGRTDITAGSLTVLGLDASREVRKVKLRVGVVPQDSNLDSELTLLENLALFAQFYGIGRTEARDRARRWLDFVGLADAAGERAEELSGGMQRRAVIARSLLHDPELVVLDEPTTGLDPGARHSIWQKLADLKDQGTTLVLTSHYMDEAQRLCDRLVVMDYGRILAEGRPYDLVDEHVGDDVVEVPSNWLAMQELDHGPQFAPLVRKRLRLGNSTFLYPHPEGIRDLVAALEGMADSPRLLVRHTNLEDVFLVMTGRNLAEDTPSAEADSLRTARNK